MSALATLQHARMLPPAPASIPVDYAAAAREALQVAAERGDLLPVYVTAVLLAVAQGAR